MIGQGLTLCSIALQSVGKVLYGTFLTDIPTSLFVFLSIGMTAAVFLAGVRFCMPKQGRGPLVALNVSTAVGFIAAFFALKHLPPAIFASVEIGVSLLTAIALTSVRSGARPPMVRLLACAGIVAGCVLLAWAEIASSSMGSPQAVVWTALIATGATGVTSAFSVVICKQLAQGGWTSATTLAHRFYLTIAAAFVWLAIEPGAVTVSPAETLALIAAVGVIGILLPLLLLQIALRRTDELTVMICLAAQPILSYLIALPSPAYDWNGFVLLGAVLVTAFVGLDIAAQRWATAGKSARLSSVRSAAP